MRSDWLKFIPQIEPGYAPWLHDHGSLTRRIQNHCAKFHLRNMYAGLAVCSTDEMASLKLSRSQKIYTRDVFLYADNQPVVYAHSVISAQHLQNEWHALLHLGNRPLGALLFSHPLVRREPLRYKILTAQHPLYHQATQHLDTPPARLWARRSVFILHGAPLLVTEIFLPLILQLHGGKNET